MMKKMISLLFLSMALFVTMIAKAQNGEGLGQLIQIQSNLSSFVGKPSWLLVIRDVDHGITMPYVFDISKGNNTWFIMTYGRNYLITASTLQFSPYKRIPYDTTRRIHNFCQLESNGHIIHGQSLSISLSGDLTPNANTYHCRMTTYREEHFTVTSP